MDSLCEYLLLIFLLSFKKLVKSPRKYLHYKPKNYISMKSSNPVQTTEINKHIKIIFDANKSFADPKTV